MTEEPKFFVYVRSLDKPAAQIWYGNQVTGSGRFKHGAVGKWNSAASLVHLRELEGNDLALSLKELETKYPFEIGRPSDGFTYLIRRTVVSSPAYKKLEAREVCPECGRGPGEDHQRDCAKGRPTFVAARPSEAPGPTVIDPTVAETRRKLLNLAKDVEGQQETHPDGYPEGSD